MGQDYMLEIYVYDDDLARIDVLKEYARDKVNEDHIALQGEFSDGTVAKLTYLPPQGDCPEAFMLLLGNIGGRGDDAYYFFENQLQDEVFGYWVTDEEEWYIEQFGDEVNYYIEIIRG